ncbi:hypothetical protein [Microcystis phage Mel-JY01]
MNNSILSELMLHSDIRDIQFSRISSPKTPGGLEILFSKTCFHEAKQNPHCGVIYHYGISCLYYSFRDEKILTKIYPYVLWHICDVVFSQMPERPTADGRDHFFVHGINELNVELNIDTPFSLDIEYEILFSHFPTNQQLLSKYRFNLYDVINDVTGEKIYKMNKFFRKYLEFITKRIHFSENI